MKHKCFRFIFRVFIPILAFALFTGMTLGKDTGVQWVAFEEGITLSAKEKKLFVIDFYTDWCHWCKVMDEETYGNKAVAEYGKKQVVFAKINAETTEKFKFKDGEYSGRELSRIFGVTGFPFTAFMTSEGELLTTVSGFIPADRFQTILKYLAEGWYQKMKFEEFQKKADSAN